MATATVKAPSYQELSPAGKAQLDAFIARYAPAGEGFVLFCNEILRIPGGFGSLGEPVPFELWADQVEAAETLSRGEDVIWLKARQIGATWTVLAYIFWVIMFRKGRNIRSTSIREEDALENIERLNYFWDNLPEWLQEIAPKDPERDNKTTFGLLHTKSYMKALPSTKDAGRSHTLDIFFSDEDASNPHSAENAKSAGPTLEKRKGQYIKVSTAKGFGNHFEVEWHKGERGESRFTPIFLTWQADPNRTQDWYDELLRTEGPDYMHQEYPETPRQAFLSTGRPFFSVEKIDQLLSSPMLTPEVGYLVDGIFTPDARGHLRVYRRPEEGHRYAIFEDPAEGKEHGDDSVWAVEDIDSNEICAVMQGKWDLHEGAYLGKDLGYWYNTAVAGVEANGLGIATCLKMAELEYPMLAWKRDVVTGKVTERIGHWTDQNTRRRMLGLLQGDFREDKIKVPDQPALRQFATFVHKPPLGKPEAEEGCKDDIVLAIAGVHLLATVSYYEMPAQSPRERLEEIFGEKIRPVGAERAALREQEEQAKRGNDEANPWIDHDNVEEV